ncbi:NAD(P)-dependent oxidoreductase [Polynucleobacter sp. AP-RePozz3-80-G7]|uniref:NAD-dependent epimerase/dehydratase family protein n=1 Tax=Polynucleobacter sp. AP-RePozz3-80-G7 TaxID=2689105 RepID=UPI001C0BF83B|nr:NAD(P)-dependent oxidoreductase [Polynucleobacter sp. AP-RePozz3-80-G7]MBU3638539.1 NAD(P)-dependent oxidoreductase [Polynucleobacter sp. AP-RePozz3-80-G7]
MSDQDISPVSLKHKIALVTGVTGFIGAHLVKRLVNEGWKVHAIIRKGSKLPSLLANEELNLHLYDGSTNGLVQCVSEIKPDVVFHLASLFLSQHEVKDVEPLVQSNLLFGNQLLEAMRVNDVRNLINTGTSWQHYENNDYNPVCLYAATKQAFEAIIEFYIQACNFKVITLKLSDTYGPNDHRPKLFSLLYKASLTNTPLDMSIGEQLIDLVYIDDVINAYLIAVNRLLNNEVVGHEIYRISSGNPITLKNLVQLYITVTGRNIQLNWGARPYRLREMMSIWDREKKMTGWQPSISLKDGINRMD